ncbi:hypothetical protein, partial [Sporisorium scitamineum]
MVKAESHGPMAGLTCSSQASTSASTLESFLESASALVSLATQTTAPTDRPPILRTRTATARSVSATAAETQLSPTELARAKAYHQLHRTETSLAASSARSANVAQSGGASSAAASNEHSHPATNHAFLITYFVAGGAAGATSRTVVSPLERLKIIMQ